MNNPASNGRYICCNTTLGMDELIDTLKKHVGEGKYPRVPIPNWLAQVASHLMPDGTGSYMRANIGRGRYEFDSSKIKNELGLEYIPVETSLVDTIADGRRWKHVKF
mgnify:CR=1 FL=1